jgi:hypothetical protein
MNERSVQLAARAESDTRCAYCHAPLGPADAQTACPRCDTRLHADCVVSRRCPTLGCDHGFLVSALAEPLEPVVDRAGVFGWAAGVGLPILSFFMNEALAPLRDLPGGGAPGWYQPEVQRPLYPLLAWAVAAT